MITVTDPRPSFCITAFVVLLLEHLLDNNRFLPLLTDVIAIEVACPVTSLDGSRRF